MNVIAPRPPVDLGKRRLPPIAEIGMLSIACIVVGGIYLAANLPHHVSLAPAICVLIAGAVFLVVNVVLLSRIHDFAFDRFIQVGRWSLLAYLITSGMIEYVFVLDHTRGHVLVVLTLMLVTFALDVPLIIAFTVARYQEPGLVRPRTARKPSAA